MPDFDTRRPHEPNEPNGLRTTPIANKLRSLLFVVAGVAGLLFVVMAVYFGLSIYSSGGAGDQQEEGLQKENGKIKQQEAQQEENGKHSSCGAGDQQQEVQQQEVQQEENGKITFLRSTSDTGSTIYEMNPDGTGVTNVTDPSLGISSAGISPNGEKIAFVMYETGDLYVMNADGTDRTRIFHTQSPASLTPEVPVFSPDGKRIAFGGDAGALYVVNADGTCLTRLTNVEGVKSELVWSPNGKKIAFVNTREEGPASAIASAQISTEVDLYVADADSTNETQITYAFTPESSPTWSPDGKKIAYARGSDPNLGSANDIFVINADGSNETNLTETADPEDSPVWSPDGDKIAYLSTLSSDSSVHKVCVMNSSGTGPACLTDTGESVIRVPKFSPDGDKIAFVGQYGKVGEPAQYDIYVRNLDGTALTRLTHDGASHDILTWLRAKHE